MSTVEELRDYVKNTLGKEVTTRMTKADLQAIIDGKEKPKQTVEPVQVGKTKGKRVTIVLHSTGEDKSPLFVACNGKKITIPRDVECDVEPEFVEILDNAVQTLYDSEQNPTNVRAHPYTRL